MHFGISEGKGGGLKYGSRPWLGMDIFWNCPIHILINRKNCNHCIRQSVNGNDFNYS